MLCKLHMTALALASFTSIETLFQIFFVCPTQINSTTEAHNCLGLLKRHHLRSHMVCIKTVPRTWHFYNSEKHCWLQNPLRGSRQGLVHQQEQIASIPTARRPYTWRSQHCIQWCNSSFPEQNYYYSFTDEKINSTYWTSSWFHVAFRPLI